MYDETDGVLSLGILTPKFIEGEAKKKSLLNELNHEWLIYQVCTWYLAIKQQL